MAPVAETSRSTKLRFMVVPLSLRGGRFRPAQRVLAAPVEGGSMVPSRRVLRSALLGVTGRSGWWSCWREGSATHDRSGRLARREVLPALRRTAVSGRVRRDVGRHRGRQGREDPLLADPADQSGGGQLPAE